jgi:hypothetical protein
MPVQFETLPVLIGQGGEMNSQRWIIEENLLVGRTSSCDILLPNPQVSRRHAKFINTDEGVMVQDLNSKNGTFLNGTRVRDSIYLQDGDVIQIALAQEFLFLSNDATIPLESSEFQDIKQESRLRLDPDSHRVWINEQEIQPPLSALQFRLLEILHANQGQVMSRDELIVQVWGEQEALGVTDQALDALVRRLRDRLESVDPEYEYIVTIRGQGFRLDIPAA